MPGGKLVEINLTAERISVDAEQACCARLIAPRAIQHAFNELLFKLVDGLIKLDSTFHHLPDKRFQLIFQGCTLRARIVCSCEYRPDLCEFVAR